MKRTGANVRAGAALSTTLLPALSISLTGARQSDLLLDCRVRAAANRNRVRCMALIGSCVNVVSQQPIAAPRSNVELPGLKLV